MMKNWIHKSACIFNALLNALLLNTLLTTQLYAADNTKIMPLGLYQSPNGTIWMRCALGQTFSKGTCIGTAKEYEWYEAQKVASHFTYSGLKGWRLPSIEELHASIICTEGFAEKKHIPTKKGKRKEVQNLCEENSIKPTLDQKVFVNAPEGLFWSGTADPLQNGFAWYSYFGGGHSGIYTMKTKNFVRLVKDTTPKGNAVKDKKP